MTIFDKHPTLMKIVPKIYRIDKEQHIIAPFSTTKDIIATIIRTSYANLGWKLEAGNLNFPNFIEDGLTYYLYLHSAKDKRSDWAYFLPQQLKNDLSIFDQTKLSLLLFIETEHDLYAAVGGNAYPIIIPFVDHLFGINMYDRIISLENDEAFSTKSRRIIGHQIGMSEQFRDKYKIINYLQFGKIPKELNVKLAAETSEEHFDFLLQKAGDRLKITVNNAFRINKQVDFPTLHRIVQELLVVKQLAPKELLSSYTQVRDKKVIDDLQKELNNRLFNYIPILQGASTQMNYHFEYDFCSPNNIEAFYQAETYQLKEKGDDKNEIFAVETDKDEIVKRVMLHAYSIHGNNEQSMLFYLRGVKVHCYQGTIYKTGSGFLYHFNAEFNVDGMPVFLIDTKWYKLKDAFVKSLAIQTSTIFKTTKLPAGIIDIPWPLKTSSTHLIDEGDYNELYDGKINYFVLDTITPDGIELCDIIYVTDNDIYLIHIKHSFSARARELTNQILASARRIAEAVASGKNDLFEKVYDSILTKARSVNGITKDQFANLFYNRNLVYVFATASQFADDPSIGENLERYSSNIARFSLTTCASEIRTSYADFKTVQIPRL